MKAHRLTAQQGVALLREFYEAYGPEQMWASYGWRQVPTSLYSGERMYSFHNDDGDWVAWGSLILNTRDAHDDEAVLVVGVHPDWQRQGYRVKVLDWLSARAKRLGADRASMIVRKSNTAHYKRVMRESHEEGSPWVYAGDVWYPEPGYGYFVRPLTEERK